MKGIISLCLLGSSLALYIDSIQLNSEVNLRIFSLTRLELITALALSEKYDKIKEETDMINPSEVKIKNGKIKVPLMKKIPTINKVMVGVGTGMVATAIVKAEFFDSKHESGGCALPPAPSASELIEVNG